MKDKRQICKTIISVCIFFIIIPLVIWFGVWLFNDRKYNDGKVVDTTIRKYTPEEKDYDVHYDLQWKR